MANVLSEKEKRRLENKRLWSLRTKESQPRVTEPRSREARINELRDLVLSSASGKQLVQKVMDVALDDDHPGQMAAMKMVIDRIIPQSAFEAAKNQAHTAIQITISGLESKKADVIDV